jgi:hypothetical protein
MSKELERQQALSLNLAKQLCDRIDECEALKEEVSILREYADALNARLKVEVAQ